MLIAAYSFWIAVCLISIFSKAHTAIILVFVLYGLHKAALDPVQKTFVAELAPQDYKASSLGAFQMVIGLSALPASLIAGLLWDKVSIVSPFYLSLTLTIISLIVLTFVKEAKPSR